MRIDAHQHFWKFDPVRDRWITDDMETLRRDYLPEDLAPLLRQAGMDGCIAVQADQSEDETRFLLKLAARYSFISGVVGWVDLRADDLEERLDYFSAFPKLRGFRHIIQAEPEDEFMLRADFCRGISKLEKYGYTYDLLVQPRHLPALIRFLERFPDQPFVIDHLAKPYIREGRIEPWRQEMSRLAGFPNVFCKLSGMVTEADLRGWKYGDFRPYIDAVLGSFGTGRVMFGSDWPVCLLAATYQECCDMLEENTSGLNDSEKVRLWGQNAAAFYGLTI